MIKDGIGGRAKVIGSSIATVTIGPIPGRTPMKVPTNTPINSKVDSAAKALRRNQK